MGIYTVLEDKRVDDKVDIDLKHIVERVTSVQTVLAIILGGGFGRGEGSVLVDKMGIRPVNDYDLFIIVSDNDQTDFRSLSKDIAKEIGIRLIDLIPLKYSTLATLPANQFNYDLKYGCRHLWGENFFHIIPRYEEGCVTPESGKTLLLNRLICAIEAFSENFERRPITTEEAFFLANQTGKVVSGCMEALLMAKGKYHYSYRKRQEIFEAEFPEKQRLQQLSKRATAFKLRPSELPGFDVGAYWKKAMNEYTDVIANYFAPGSVWPREKLWNLLNNNNNESSITTNPVERVELMLLLYKTRSFLSKKSILSRVRKELTDITKAPFNNAGWETLRERTARVWHELCH